jgi:hypothetical protein
MDDNLEINNVSGLYGFKYNGVYHMFFKNNFCEYENIGKSYIIELHGMSTKKIEYIKKNLQSVSKKALEEKSPFPYSGFVSTSENLYSAYFVEISLFEPSISDKIQYIYIMDLDSNALVVKHKCENKRFKFIDIQNLWSGRFGYVSPF